MSSILYPVATDAAAALAGPAGRAVRQREAEQIAGEAVTFVTDTVGPPTRPGRPPSRPAAGGWRTIGPASWWQIPPEDRYARLVEVVTGGRPPPPPLRSSGMVDAGPRHPRRQDRLAAAGHLLATRFCGAVIDDVQARKARVQARETLDPQTLRALTRQPLRAVRPQQPLDIGLFERRLPESPHIVVPDE